MDEWILTCFTQKKIEIILYRQIRSIEVAMGYWHSWYDDSFALQMAAADSCNRKIEHHKEISESRIGQLLVLV